MTAPKRKRQRETLPLEPDIADVVLNAIRDRFWEMAETGGEYPDVDVLFREYFQEHPEHLAALEPRVGDVEAWWSRTWKPGPDWPDPNPACAACRFPYPEMYMLHDALWCALNGGQEWGLLCLTCANARAERLLGRSLSAADSEPDVPVNVGYLLCFQLGARTATPKPDARQTSAEPVDAGDA